MTVERGQILSHYRLIEKIGEGGMGVVWKAEDTLLGRTVAIKVLPSDVARDEKRRKMFFDEARLASSLSEAYIVQVHDFGREGDLDFIVMEYVEGKPLNKILHGKPMPPERVAEIGHQVARALSKAHHKGLLHRDLKPANILITPDGDAKVVDFGLATLFTPQETTIGTAGPTQSLTEGAAEQRRGVVGTIPYMSPEQVRGEKLDARSDIFSLGTVLYEMTTGQRPFRGATNQDLATEILKSRPKPVHIVVPKVPLDLDRIITKALSPRRGDRYQNTEDLAVDLKRLGRELESGSSPSYEELGKAVEPKRRLWLGVTALLAVGILATAFGYWKSLTEKVSPEGKRRKMIVVLPFENLGPPEDEYFASGMTEEITSRLAVVSGLGVISRTSAFQYERTGKNIKQIGEDFGVDYVLEGTVRWARESMGTSRVRITPQLIRVRDDTHLWAEAYERVIDDIFQVQSDIAGKVIDQLGVTLLEPERRAVEARPTEVVEAYDFYLRGNQYLWRSTREQDKRVAVQMYEKAVELDPSFALAYAKLSEAHSSIYWFHYDRSEERLAKAKEAVEKAFTLEPGLPEAHQAQGYYYYWGHLDYDHALEQFALALKSQPNNAELLAAIGYVRRRQGKLEEAVANLEKVVEVAPRSAVVLYNTAETYHLLRDYAEAERYYDRTISLSPQDERVWAFKAMLYLSWEGSTEKARRVLEEASETIGSTDDPNVVLAWVLVEVFDGKYQEALDRLSLGSADALADQFIFIPKALLSAQIHGWMNRPQLARADYDTARALLETKLQEQPQDERLHSSLGIAYAGLDRVEEAIREGKMGVELLPVSKEAWRGLYRVEDLARIYVMVGEYDAAIDQLEFLLSRPGEISIPLIQLDPTWDPLRDHPRFQELVEKYG